jgi:hypothetical protein
MMRLPCPASPASPRSHSVTRSVRAQDSTQGSPGRGIDSVQAAALGRIVRWIGRRPAVAPGTGGRSDPVDALVVPFALVVTLFVALAAQLLGLVINAGRAGREVDPVFAFQSVGITRYGGGGRRWSTSWDRRCNGPRPGRTTLHCHARRTTR